MIKKIVMLSLAGVIFLAPFYAKALSGTRAKNVKVKMYSEKNGVWFRSGTKRADENGVLEIKNVMPGWCKFQIVDKDVKSGQSLAAKARMLDAEGHRINKKTNVDIYLRINNEKVFYQTVETDEEGWLELSGLTSGTIYKLSIDEKDSSSLSQKDGKVRIKVKANALSYSSGGWTDWFRAGYYRTDENRLLEVKNVLPIKYKFSYKEQDSPDNIPFNLKARMLDKDGARIKEPTTFLLYFELNDELQPAGAVTTDDDGWIFVPGLLPNMTYKVDML